MVNRTRFDTPDVQQPKMPEPDTPSWLRALAGTVILLGAVPGTLAIFAFVAVRTYLFLGRVFPLNGG